MAANADRVAGAAVCAAIAGLACAMLTTSFEWAVEG
jgi:hypothetical protein